MLHDVASFHSTPMAYDVCIAYIFYFRYRNDKESHER